MSINPSDFRSIVINPALSNLSSIIPISTVAADLLMATAAVESSLGTYLTQIKGPALGIFQIDPASLSGLQLNLTTPQRVFLANIATPQPYSVQIETNLLLAASICRLFYWQIPAPLPPDTISGLWSYYKTYYNTALGSTTQSQFLSALKLTDLTSLPS